MDLVPLLGGCDLLHHLLPVSRVTSRDRFAAVNATETQRYCAFCGLPVPPGISFGRTEPTQELEYCCSGCRTVERADAEQGRAAKNLLRIGLAIFFTMNVMVFSMALWSQSVYPEDPASAQLAHALRNVFRWANLLFSLPVLWLLGRPILLCVHQSIRNRSITTDLLIVIGVTSAFAYSSISVIRGTGHIYFEVGCMVLVFVSLGRWLEANGKLRAGESLDRMAKLLPETVRLLQSTGGFQDVPRQKVRTGDVLRVLAGQRIPLDGTIVAGEGQIDQQMVTGESHFVVNKVGDTVYGGTLNIDGDLQVQVSAENGQETLSRMINLIRTARGKKGRQEQLADLVATWFVPADCVVALWEGWQQ